MKVLLVEDDLLLADGVQVALSRKGYAVDHVTRGKDALSLVSSEDSCPDLIILDLGLPDMDGLDLLPKIHQKSAADNFVPVLILSARDALPDKVAGLDSGGDDYLTKPFEVAELLARLRVLERRAGNRTQTSQSATIALGPVSLNTSNHRMRLNSGEEIELPRREFSILRILMENPGRIYSREQLNSKLYNWENDVASNAVDVHLHNLRKKTGADFIRTIRGVGWLVEKHP
ncbi:response regulator [Endozoicomonas numazuensis]|uniref:XRE family transcriptional regulator n=1 Tax=Endozoicomonas numazuensis TaxID=1137799 RepID=A0A081NJ89_9GAMM|nr:response regulator transcription factor [Endozoicomonas numazuensis]KEQ18512.1 XRE family transcriptional regulator [Endozoicomonas numazuensis]